MKYAEIGSISHGTLRAEDLITTFVCTLECLIADGNNGNAGAYSAPMHRANELEVDPDTFDYVDPDLAGEVMSTLIDALSDFAPPYCYFGTLEGDGAEFGFWVHSEFQQAMREDGVLEVGDLADIPADYIGEVLLVNDHGNATFGYQDHAGSFATVWSIV